MLFELKYRQQHLRFTPNETVCLDAECNAGVRRYGSDDHPIFWINRTHKQAAARLCIYGYQEYTFRRKQHLGIIRRVFPRNRWILETDRCPTTPDTRFQIVSDHEWIPPTDWPDMYIYQTIGTHNITLMSKATAPFAERLLSWLFDNNITHVVVRASDQFQWHTPLDLYVLMPYFASSDLHPNPCIFSKSDLPFTCQHIPDRLETIAAWLACDHHTSLTRQGFWRTELRTYADVLFATGQSAWNRLPVVLQLLVFQYLTPFVFRDEELQELLGRNNP